MRLTVMSSCEWTGSVARDRPIFLDLSKTEYDWEKKSSQLNKKSSRRTQSKILLGS